MIRPIMKDVMFLSRKAKPATKDDMSIAQDLMDTLAAHDGECVGMAANMIGFNKSIIIVDMGFMDYIMFNPVITVKARPYETEEGCLSLKGQRKTTRYDEIEVEFMDINWKPQKMKYQGVVAQIIQHEVDHTNGIII